MQEVRIALSIDEQFQKILRHTADLKELDADFEGLAAWLEVYKTMARRWASTLTDAWLGPLSKCHRLEIRARFLEGLELNHC